MSHTEISNLIVGGDWNVTLQAIDKKSGTPWRPTLYRDKLVSIMDDIGLIDVFRKLYPNGKSFSYESKSLKVSSRIDFFSSIVISGSGAIFPFYVEFILFSFDFVILRYKLFDFVFCKL